MPHPRILLIEDELPLRVSVADALRDEGYRVLTAADGEAGLAMTLREKPDALVLDVMLPKLDGFALCRELRRMEIHTPVLMLTARGQVEDRVQGLDSGADDYLIKPFSLSELHARLRALLRRVELRAMAGPVTAGFGDVRVDLARRSVTRAGKNVPLTAREFGVLELLVRHAGEAVSRDQFLDIVWGYAAFPTTRTVDNHIARLRARLEPDPANPVHILTMPKTGYRLLTNSAASVRG